MYRSTIKKGYYLKFRMPQNVDLMRNLVFLFFVHPFNLRVLGSLSYLLIYGIPLIYLALNRNTTHKLINMSLRKGIRKYYFGLLFLGLWSVLTIILNGSDDYSFFSVILSVFRGLVRFLFLAVLTYKECVKYKKSFVETFVYRYVMANVIYVIFTIIFVAFSGVKNVWFSIIEQSALRLTEQSIYRNRIGINGFAGYRETFACSLSVILSMLMLENTKESKSRFVISLVMCMIGNFFYGRTGLIVSAICLILYLIWYRKFGVKQLIIIWLTLTILYFGANYLSVHNASFNSTINWATKPIIELLQTGTTDNYSFNRITHEMRFMPEYKTFMIGDGYYIDPSTGHYYMRTDLGFMRLMLFGGIIACIITYLTMLYGIIKIKKYGVCFLIELLILFVAFEYKGDIWYALMPILMVLQILDGFETLKDGEGKMRHGRKYFN